MVINKQNSACEEKTNVLAILNCAANVLDELNNGSYTNSAVFDSIIKLRSEHRLLSQHGIGENQTVPLL